MPRPGLYGSNKVCDRVKHSQLNKKGLPTTSAAHHHGNGCSHSLCICPLIMGIPQRWQTECSVGDGELLQAFGSLHHGQRSMLRHLNCFMKDKRTPDFQHEEYLFFAQYMNVNTFISLCHSEEKKIKNPNGSSLVFLNKAQIYCCEGFH